MTKSFYFYTTLSLIIILGLIISGYIFGWTIPTANPPSSNLPPLINAGSTNQAKVGYLSIGTSTPPTYPLEVGNQLRVWGQLISKVASGTAPFVIDSPTKVTNLNADLLDGYHAADLMATQIEIPLQAGTYFYNGGNPYYCKKQTVNSDGSVSFQNINSAYICDTNKVCNNGECVSAAGGGTYCDDDNDGYTSSYLVVNCTNKKYAPGTDCDDSCPSCYPSSPAWTDSPNGLDENCNGTIDEQETIPPQIANKILVYMTTSTYTGNLGGRNGADAKCDLGSTLYCYPGKNRALLSVDVGDYINIFPTLYGYSTNKGIFWYNRSNSSTTLLANNWADMCDGSIANTQQTGTGDYSPPWTGSTQTCGAAQRCVNWTDETSRNLGYTGSYYSTGNSWLQFQQNNCNGAYKLRCICEVPSAAYR